MKQKIAAVALVLGVTVALCGSKSQTPLEPPLQLAANQAQSFPDAVPYKAHSATPLLLANNDIDDWIVPINMQSSSKTTKKNVGQQTRTTNRVPMKPKPPALITVNPQVPPFDAVHVGSCIKVDILSHQKHQNLQLQGTYSQLSQVRYRVENNTLFIHANYSILKLPHCPDVTAHIAMKQLVSLVHTGEGNVHARKVYSRNLVVDTEGVGTTVITGHRIGLRELRYNGYNNVTIHDIDSPSLALYIRGTMKYTGHIILTGKANLHVLNYKGYHGTLVLPNIYSNNLNLYVEGLDHLTIHGRVALHNLYYIGDGRITIYWIDSPEVSVTVHGHADVALAGVANMFHAKLDKDTHMDARYLRADYGYIQTTGTSEADVWVRENLNTFAVDHSDIYFFTKPVFLTMDTRLGGSVLPMYNIPGALLHFNAMRF